MSEQAFDLVAFWYEGGLWMYPVALLGFLAVFASGIALAGRNRGFALAALLAAQLPLGLGAAGWAYNRHYVDEVLVQVSPEDRETLRAVGNAEALRPLQLGGGLWMLAMPLAVVAFAAGRKRETLER